MSGKLAGKVAVVTGGNSGIGEATAKLFATEGASIAILARREAEGRRVQQEIAGEGGRAEFVRCDVSDRASVRHAVQAVVRSFGGIDILFNNAGVSSSDPFPDEDDDHWDMTIAVNLTGAFLMCKAVWPHLVSARGGAIVNMSSLAAQRGFNQKMYDISGTAAPSYYAAKAGVDALTRYLAGLGGAYGIRVNGVRPGQILTPGTTSAGRSSEHAFKRVFDAFQILEGPGYPEDVANMVLFLVSSESRFITGEIINIDGGMPAKI